jgi:hypothetical protein
MNDVKKTPTFAELARYATDIGLSPDNQRGAQAMASFKAGYEYAGPALEQLKMIRHEAWVVLVNNGWGDRHATSLASRVYELCVEAVGPEPNDTRPRING